MLTDEDVDTAIAAVAIGCDAHPLMGAMERRVILKHAPFAAKRLRELVNCGAITGDTLIDDAVAMVGFGWLFMAIWRPSIRWMVQLILDAYFYELEQDNSRASPVV